MNIVKAECSIDQLHKAYLSKLKNHDQLLEYISKTGDILEKYYSGNHEHDLKHQYLMLTDPNYRIKHSKTTLDINCGSCNVTTIYNEREGCYVCPNCGETEYTLTFQYNNIHQHHYKKVNHYTRVTYLIELLNKLQSREPKHVPDHIIELIKTKLDKQIIDPEHIHSIMKENKLRKYYSNIRQIYCAITGCPFISISQQTQQLIIQMFKQIEPIYNKLCPNRKKFLKYSYVLNKLFHILDMPHIANYFSLMKMSNKLKEHDRIFSEICKQLNWNVNLYVNNIDDNKLLQQSTKN